jgi:hypothetical protein
MKNDGHLDFFKTSGTSPPDKLTCSSCGEVKAVDCFHKKPGRKTGRDSRCKDCVSKKKKTKYVAAKNMDVVSGLKRIFEITNEGLRTKIENEIKKLEGVISCLKK